MKYKVGDIVTPANFSDAYYGVDLIVLAVAPSNFARGVDLVYHCEPSAYSSFCGEYTDEELK